HHGSPHRDVGEIRGAGVLPVMPVVDGVAAGVAHPRRLIDAGDPGRALAMDRRHGAAVALRNVRHPLLPGADRGGNAAPLNTVLLAEGRVLPGAYKAVQHRLPAGAALQLAHPGVPALLV